MQEEKEINNFRQIKTLLQFDNHERDSVGSRNFYFLQILQRKKENKELENHSRLIKPYYIYSLEQLDKYEEEIIKLCKTFNARAYIHLNRRNDKMVALDCMRELAHFIGCDQYFTISKIYNTCCGRANSVDKSWVIDIDGYTSEGINKLECYLSGVKPFDITKIIVKIPTKNGIHLITKPFDLSSFHKVYSDIEIHKNNPTLIFC